VTFQQPPSQQPYPPASPPAPPGWGAPPSPQPPRRRGPSRRTVLVGALGVAVAGGGAAAAVAAGHHSAASADQGADGSNGWDPGTLPGAAGAAGGISAQEIAALLDTMNKALTSRDRAAFTAGYAPGAAATSAAQLFDNLAHFDFASAAFKLLGQGSRQFNTGSGATVQIDVAFVHQLRGIDAAEVPEWYRFTLARPSEATPPRITAATGSPSANGSVKYVYYPAAWDAPGPITVITRPNVVLVAENAHDAAILARHADEAQAAIAANNATWSQGHGPDGTSPGVLMVGTSNRERFYELFSGKANQHGFEAGLTTPLLSAASMDSPDADIKIGGARITLDLTSSYFTDGRGEDTPATLFGHEGAHAKLYPLMTAADSTIPLYVVEGVADWLAKHSYPNAIAADPNFAAVKASAAGQIAGSWDGKTFPSNAQVYASDPTAMAAGYGLSTLIYHFIFAKKGLDAVCAFAAANYQVPAQGSVPGTDDVAGAASRALGMDLATFQAQWADYVHGLIAA